MDRELLDLYGKPKPTFKLYLMCNYPPGEDQFPLTDADWKRMKAIPPFESRWNLPENETQKK